METEGNDNEVKELLQEIYEYILTVKPYNLYLIYKLKEVLDEEV